MSSRGRGRGREARGSDDLIERMAQLLEAMVHNQGGELAKYQGLSAFTRHNPLKFEGGFNPKGAQRWVANVEKIFNAMGCHEEYKVVYATYLLCGEAEDWWRFVSRNCRKKSIIFEANTRGKTVDTRGAGPLRHDRRPPRFSKGSYSSLNSSQSRGSSSQEKSNGSGSRSGSFRGPLKCFRCGGPHIVKDCPQPKITCHNCGKLGHTTNVCWAARRSSSASAIQRPKSRGSAGPSTGQNSSIPGRVFAMNGAEASQSEELIRGKCIIKGRLLDVLFDSGATHSFVSVDCVKSLGLYVVELPCNVVVTTPTVLSRIGPTTYRIALPLNLSNLHPVFHVSQLRQYVPDHSHVIDLDPVQVREDLSYDVYPVRIAYRCVKQIRGKEISLVKVIWNSSDKGDAT
ncbi:uncharacterized protein LOC113866043 [Abrus precatorius]|uniref:Uncharacterized protein LOC113866043 n=1 Tax=Abrus precatorius TaxID=3816 RepID=A0A8B8LPE1_ABRPR|nr:uncharacterized protein LOC113866043 [Abrus precatorius]